MGCWAWAPSPCPQPALSLLLLLLLGSPRAQPRAGRVSTGPVAPQPWPSWGHSGSGAEAAWGVWWVSGSTW